MDQRATPLAPARRPRRRLSREARRAELLDAAEEVFAEAGADATFDRIAEHAGVTRSLLYTYFDSLESLYLECHRAAREELEHAQALAVLEVGTLEDRLRAGLRAYLRFVRERPARWQLLYGASAVGAPVASEASELRFATAERVAALIAAAVPTFPPRQANAIGHMISGAAEQFAKWWVRQPDVDEQAAEQMLVDTIWAG